MNGNARNDLILVGKQKAELLNTLQCRPELQRSGEYTQRLCGSINALMDARAAANEGIDTLTNCRRRSVLRAIYLLGRPRKDVARETQLDPNGINSFIQRSISRINAGTG